MYNKVQYMNEVVSLNVGGTPRDYTRGNLCQAQDSLLAKFFLKANFHNLLIILPNGSIYLDRDP